MTVSVCNINQEMNEELKAFRFSRSTKPRALILKIDPASKGKNNVISYNNIPIILNEFLFEKTNSDEASFILFLDFRL